MKIILSPRQAWLVFWLGASFYSWSLRWWMSIDCIRWWWEGIGDRLMDWALQTPELEIALALHESTEDGDELSPVCREARARPEEFAPIYEECTGKKLLAA